MALKRAIVVVPGWDSSVLKRPRRTLAEHLKSQNDGFNLSEGTIAGETFRRLSTGSEDLVFDIYEVTWSDLVLLDEPSNALGRLRQALQLISYWLFSPIFKAFRHSMVMTVGLLLAGVLMVVWLAVGLVAVAPLVVELTAPAPQASKPATPDQPASGSAVKTATQPEAETAAAKDDDPDADAQEDSKVALAWALNVLGLRRPALWLSDIARNPAFLLIALLAGLAQLASLRRLATFARDYFINEDGYGETVRDRVQDTLMRVYSHGRSDSEQQGAVDVSKQPGVQERPYDEVFLVGHSFGAVIALQSIAAITKLEVRALTTLITWGSPIAVLANRSPKLEQSVEEACSGAVGRWIDIFSRRDWLCASIPQQAAAFTDASRDARFEVPFYQVFKSHQKYFSDPQTLADLTKPSLGERGKRKEVPRTGA